MRPALHLTTYFNELKNCLTLKLAANLSRYDVHSKALFSLQLYSIAMAKFIGISGWAIPEYDQNMRLLLFSSLCYTTYQINDE